ncbi:MAG: hypothetical protein ACOY46_18550 [Bacillota bacterium]
MTGAGACRGPALHIVALLFVKTFVRDADFRKSLVCFSAAVVLEGIGRRFAAVRRAGVGIFETVLYQTGRWRWRNPWMSLLSAFAGLIIALLMVPLECINLLGFLLEKAGGKLKTSGNSHINRWSVRYKGKAV